MRTPITKDSDDVRERHKPTSGDWLAIGSILWDRMLDAASEADVLATIRRQARKRREQKRLPCGELMIAPRLGNWRIEDRYPYDMTYESTYDRWWRGDDRTKWTDGAVEIYGEGLKENRKPRRTFREMSPASARRMFWRLDVERNCRS